MPRYSFDEFVLSPRRRLLLRGGSEQPLIPRYFDLLVFLVEHRHEAVHRRDIFDRVWRDAVVSESALSQAVRTIRRTLGDDPRDPRYIRTVSRHGYQFVFPDVIEEADDAGGPEALPDASATIGFESSLEPVALSSEPQLQRAARAAAQGMTAGAAGGAIAGLAAGGLGGLILSAAPGSMAPIALAPVLAVIAAVAGAVGGAGVGAGVAFAEAAARSHRTLALTSAAALGGGLVGSAVQWLAGWGLAALVGLDINIGGGLEGVVIGGFAGLGFAIATVNSEDKRLQAAVITAAFCGLAGLTIALLGRPLAAGTIHAIADAAEGSRATLAPLGRLIGEPDFGPVSGAILAFGECASFGFGLACGLLRRRRSGQ